MTALVLAKRAQFPAPGSEQVQVLKFRCQALRLPAKNLNEFTSSQLRSSNQLPVSTGLVAHFSILAQRDLFIVG